MLRATIDSSLLNSFSIEGLEPATEYTFTPQLTVLLTGLHWEGEIPKWIRDNILNNKENADKVLFPWKWEKPTHIRIYWLKAEASGFGLVPNSDGSSYSSVLIINHGESDDSSTLRNYFEGVLNDTIWKDGVLNEKQIRWGTNNKIEEVEIKDDFETKEGDTGFLKSSIAQFAQKLPPLNQKLNLVCFANQEVTVPKEATHFVTFPVGGNWWKFKNEDNKPQINNGKFTLSYHPEIFKNDYTFEVNSPETPLTYQETNNVLPIKLRNHNGDFQGTVDIKAFDIDDYTNTLLDGVAVHFDLPAWMVGFIESKLASEANLIDTKKIDNFLWASVRDSLGFGYKMNPEGSSIVHAIVKQFCDETVGKLEEIHLLDKDQKLKKTKEYWKTYDDQVKILTKEFESADKNRDGHFYELDKWKTFIQVNLSKIINESTDTDKPKLELRVKELVKELFLLTESDENIILRWKGEKDKKRGIFDILNDGSVQALIVSLQWINVSTIYKENENGEKSGFLIDWVNKLSNDKKPKDGEEFNFLFNQLLQVGELKHEQQYSIIAKYKIDIADTDNPLKNEVTNNIELEISPIGNKVITSIEKYFNSRIAPNQEEYYPTQVSPFPDESWKAFIGFVKTSLSNPVEETVSKCINKPANDVTSVFLKVDSYNKIKRDGAVGNSNENTEDLNDEIAGHIVLMRREDAIGSVQFNKEWKYLNKVQVSIKPIEPDSDKPFDNKYVIPAFIPESIDTGKNPYLELRNEKLSLIAGHHTFDDRNENPEIPPEKHLTFDFDKESAAYAFWYGCKYQFAGFVALNSGVLPGFLREEGTWNIPKQTLGKEAIDHAAEYHHLRRVPVSKVRVEPVGNILAPPQGLLPLAFELPEWRGDEVIKDEKGKDFEQTHYLLAKTDSFEQNSITLNLKKPTTSFWNWYAWLGDESNKLIKVRNEDCTVKTDTDGKEVIKTLAAIALERELENRNSRLSEEKKENLFNFWDPAVDDKIKVKVKRLFPTLKPIGNIYLNLKYEKSCNKEPNIETEDELKYFSDVAKDLIIEVGSKTATDVNKRIITIAQGDIIQIEICSRISKNHFQSDNDPVNQNAKFYSWMKNSLTEDEDDTDYYLNHPVEIWFEASKPLATLNHVTRKIENEIFKPVDLWKSIELSQTSDKVHFALEKTDKNYDQFAYASRIEVKHQVWNWNGRLEESEMLIEKNQDGRTKLAEPLDPENKTTTQAMKWEAWAFSDRPDYSALVHDANLLASRNGEKDAPLPHKQILFSDLRPTEEKALYYRFTAVAHSRYEKLGGDYSIPIEAKVDLGGNVTNPWRRYFRKSSKTKQLPKPSIRFVIPLTRSIKECNETEHKEENKISAASLLIVLNDRWFTEAGLAEQLEVGIDVVKDPVENEAGRGGEYLQAGHDPILDGRGLSNLKTDANKDDKEKTYIDENGDTKVAVFKPKGPAGLTFEPHMQTPLVRGSSFILNIPDVSGLLEKNDKMQAWAMMQIAVRRTLRKELCEEGLSVEALRSGWTAKEWVQFLPAVDSFIPKTWRDAVRKEGAINLEFTNGLPHIPETILPVFDSNFEERTQRYLIVTERVYDIGGQPCENYVGAFKYETNERFFTLSHTDKSKEELENIKDGYCRLLLVRIDLKTAKNETDIWKMLFGENATIKADLNIIQNDPMAALPLVTERIPFTNKKI